ncbi:calcium-binding protein [Streptomyces atroolivaceus]|uniref:calcium-binding protein n=1 Tax=Streptomyces atroolivaceus TaxID=66869 RepID=UPI0036AE42C7
MNRNRAAVGAVAVTLFTAGLAVGPAVAATATEAKARVGADWATQSIVFAAAAGQTNNLNIFSMYTSDGIRRIGFSDVVPLEPGDHCAYSRAEDTTSVVCELPADSPRPDRIDVSLGDGNDTIAAFTPGIGTVHAGPGDDHAMGGDGRDVILGGPGNDTLDGEGGDDLVCGGTGKDTLEGGPGRDVVLP